MPSPRASSTSTDHFELNSAIESRISRAERVRSAILRWCVNGCLQWQQAGLAPPAVVRDATDSYFAEQDTLQQWLEDCAEDGGALAFTRLSELFASCEERNLRPGTSTTLSDLLAAKTYARKREPHTGHRGFAGVSLKKR